MHNDRFCQITACGVRILFPEGTVFVLDDGKAVHTCPSCARKIRRGMKERG